jgi:hypothetical protein
MNESKVCARKDCYMPLSAGAIAGNFTFCRPMCSVLHNAIVNHERWIAGGRSARYVAKLVAERELLMEVADAVDRFNELVYLNRIDTHERKMTNNR